MTRVQENLWAELVDSKPFVEGPRGLEQVILAACIEAGKVKLRGHASANSRPHVIERQKHASFFQGRSCETWQREFWSPRIWVPILPQPLAGGVPLGKALSLPKPPPTPDLE